MKLKATLYFMLFGFICFACGSSDPMSTVDKPKELGEKVYKKNCKLCHGGDGKANRAGALDITASTLDLDERILLITNGRKTMTPYKDVLTKKEIKAVAEYTFTLK